MTNELQDLYKTWQSMLRRCYTPTNKAYPRYGGRGIIVCDAWRNSFYQFALDMGERPTGYSIERIDNDGNYEPSNCKWATSKEQQRNQSVTRKVQIEGITYIAVELADKYGLKTDTIVNRANQGLSFLEVTSRKRRVFIDGLKLGGLASGAKKRDKTHCSKGHEFTEENTHITKNGWRSCRKCHAEQAAIRRAQLGIKKRIFKTKAEAGGIVIIDGNEYQLDAVIKSSQMSKDTVIKRIKLGLSYDEVIGPAMYNNAESVAKAVQVHADMKRAQTHCKHGHEFTEENTYHYKGHRSCRKCRQAMDKFLYYKKQRPLSDFL
jgi:Zn finger protein HypA/HybF involved in hydrogenase expression